MLIEALLPLMLIAAPMPALSKRKRLLGLPQRLWAMPRRKATPAEASP